MVTALAFRGLRYSDQAPDGLAALVAPPYDVVGPEARAQLAARSAANVIGIELPSGDDDRYERAAILLAELRASGVLALEREPALYVLEETFDLYGVTRRRVGLFAAVPVDPWATGQVLPHEHTLPGPKRDRLALLQATQTNLSPIFIMVDDPAGELRSHLVAIIAGPPDVDLTLPPGSVEHAANRHRLWVVSDQATLTQLQSVLARSQAYIADGHHRYETALTYRDLARQAHAHHPDGPWDNALLYLATVQDPDLAVLPFHRVVRGLPAATVAGLRAALEAHYQLTPLDASIPVADHLATMAKAGPGALLLADGGQRLTLLTPKSDLAAHLPADRSAAWRDLAVSQLHGIILQPMLGLGDAEIQSEHYVSYVRDATEALAMVASGEAQLAFLLQPTQPAQVCAVARAHDRMPQKSTFFYPKPLTGLVLYPHSD